jgi:hypothetical protein
LAQSSSRFEVGAQVSTLRLTHFDATNSGLGGRGSFDVSRWLAIEGELNFFPRDRVEVESSPGPAADIRIGYSRTRFEGFVGPKLGLRRDKYGLFGKIQPGFARLTDKGVRCVSEDCARMLFLLARPDYRTEFAMNLGGVLEFYPSPRIVTRLDLGTTLIRHRSFAPPWCDGCTSSNFSSRVGVGFRF